ncbi:hypothetical protein QYF36_007385 [Acer negundo]|nr:hypothetical protein QYF36_007385 [Acer negundo]
MPSYFTQHHDKNSKTAKELFIEKHKIQHKEAQQWIKETSKSCSGVAVLVATVVFAAASQYLVEAILCMYDHLNASGKNN